jgi:putative endonuclease
MSTIDVGRIGENAAADYLKKKGYKIIERNHRTRWFEIDIVAFKKNKLIFVEVRAKNGTEFGSPEDTIDYKKLGKIIKAAQGYIAFRAPRVEMYQIDAVCVVLDGSEIERISHYENITL